MAESIEAFVKKLQEEGVEAGRQAEREIRSAAEKQAEAILDEAHHEAQAIVDAAHEESQQARARTETELALAMRDAQGRLQDTLSHILQALLHHTVEEKLRDSVFLAELIRDVVLRYVEADLADGEVLTVNVSDELRSRLGQWALQTFHVSAGETSPVKLQTSMAEAGFEYRVADGTVEVTATSVVELLMQMVSPELRKFVAQTAPSEPHDT